MKTDGVKLGRKGISVNKAEVFVCKVKRDFIERKSWKCVGNPFILNSLSADFAIPVPLNPPDRIIHVGKFPSIQVSY